MGSPRPLRKPAGSAWSCVRASGCRASPTPGVACHRVTGSRHQLHRHDVPDPPPQPPARLPRPSSAGRKIATTTQATRNEARPTEPALRPWPGRQTPTNDDQGQPSTPDIRPAQSLYRGSELVGDGRVDLYAGFCARRGPEGSRRRRSSISACRHRQAPAAYPQTSGGQPSIACAGRRLCG